MRSPAPAFSVWLMNSKLKAVIIASRTRQSAKRSRRVFMTSPVIPVGRPCGISDFTMSPRSTAGKEYCSAHLAAFDSRNAVRSPPVNASNITVPSVKNSIRISSRFACPRMKGRSFPQ